MSHEHKHDDHDHDDRDHGHHHGHIQNIKLAAFINIAFTAIEIVGGAMTNSLAIIADAFHDLGDSAVLITAWKIEQIAQKKPDWKRTFGYRRLSLLSAFLNASVLLGGTSIVVFQAIGRLANPQPVHAEGMIGLAVIGIIANAAGALRLRGGKTANEKVLSWHLLEDVFGWISILLAATIIKFTDFFILDPIFTIGFSVFLLWGIWRNSKELFNIFLEGAPSRPALNAILQEIEKVAGIQRVYDIHLWSLDGQNNLFSMKALISEKSGEEEIQEKIKKILETHHIVHSTVELDTSKNEDEKTEQEFLK